LIVIRVLPFGATVLEFSIATFFSSFIGIALIIAASKFVRARYIAAFAFGVYLWFFTDTIGDANYLNVNAGPVFSSYTFCLVVLFLVGLVAFFAVDGRLFAVGEETARYGMIVAVLAALAGGFTASAKALILATHHPRHLLDHSLPRSGGSTPEFHGSSTRCASRP